MLLREFQVDLAQKIELEDNLKSYNLEFFFFFLLMF
jgi:hypothetical protein